MYMYLFRCSTMTTHVNCNRIDLEVLSWTKKWKLSCICLANACNGQ